MLELFLVFFKIGLFTFGGGYAMIPLMQQEITGRGWMSLAQLTDFIAVAEVTPGPFAVNTATFVGMERFGVAGAVVATAGVVLPSFLILLFIAHWFLGFAGNRHVQAALKGVRPAVTGLVAAAVWALGRVLFYHKETGASWRTILIFAVLAAVQWKWKPHPVKLIGLAMLAGLVVFGVVPKIGVLL